MAAIWTHGTWVVKPGKEEAFVAAWSRLARRGSELFDATPPTLLRDRDRPDVFLTMGPWRDLDAIAEFRGSDVFASALEEIRPLIESFETRTLDEVEWS